MAQFVLICWIPLVIALFKQLAPRRAVMISFVAGWLLLPNAAINVPGLPPWDKMGATCLAPAIGALLTDRKRFLALRPAWIDLPIISWCLIPLATSMSNGLGLYDGVSASLAYCVAWGIPVYMGRVYLGTREAMLEAAETIIVGTLAYLPFCWLEIAISPQLHRWIYGFYQHSFDQTMRYGGFRPVVFLPDGIAVSVLVALSFSLVVFLWRSEAITKIAGMPIAAAMALLGVTLVGCKTMSGLGIAAVMAFIAAIPRLKVRRAIQLALILGGPLYIVARVTDTLPASMMEDWVARIDVDRAQSFGVRLRQEDLFTSHASKQPWFGWGGWMRSFPVDEDGVRLTNAVDGFWLIAISMNGYLGLTLIMSVMLIAPVALLRVNAGKTLGSKEYAPIEAMSFVVCASVINNLFNGQANPLFVLAMGGLGSLAINSAWAASPSAASVQGTKWGPRSLARTLVSGEARGSGGVWADLTHRSKRTLGHIARGAEDST
jgi:hypothetical protein